MLQEYVDLAADLGARHLNVQVGSFGLAPDERSWEGLLRNLTERHDTRVPPADPGELAGALDLLPERGCEFWVLELLGREGLEQTRRVVDRYLAPENPKST